jgi:hypothetical protein
MLETAFVDPNDNTRIADFAFTLLNKKIINQPSICVLYLNP